MTIGQLTGRQARLLLTMLDNQRAARELDDDDYRLFWQAKSKLLWIELQEQLKVRRLSS
jgi:hypothetical protein